MSFDDRLRARYAGAFDDEDDDENEDDYAGADGPSALYLRYPSDAMDAAVSSGSSA
jgi:hypothetical protein